jgi:hypothetical protein
VFRRKFANNRYACMVDADVDCGIGSDRVEYGSNVMD